jgi:DNA-binding MarR family transcriptional regulator
LARLFIQHHSAVELVNRLEITGAIARTPGTEDKREVWVRLTPAGRAILRRLALAHRMEMERSGPELARALNSVLRHNRTGVAPFQEQERRQGRSLQGKARWFRDPADGGCGRLPLSIRTKFELQTW